MDEEAIVDCVWTRLSSLEYLIDYDRWGYRSAFRMFVSVRGILSCLWKGWRDELLTRMLRRPYLHHCFPSDMRNVVRYDIALRRLVREATRMGGVVCGETAAWLWAHEVDAASGVQRLPFTAPPDPCISDGVERYPVWDPQSVDVLVPKFTSECMRVCRAFSCDLNAASPCVVMEEEAPHPPFDEEDDGWVRGLDQLHLLSHVMREHLLVNAIACVDEPTPLPTSISLVHCSSPLPLCPTSVRFKAHPCFPAYGDDYLLHCRVAVRVGEDGAWRFQGAPGAERAILRRELCFAGPRPAHGFEWDVLHHIRNGFRPPSSFR